MLFPNNLRDTSYSVRYYVCRCTADTAELHSLSEKVRDFLNESKPFQVASWEIDDLKHQGMQTANSTNLSNFSKFAYPVD